ncbi:MAG: hypothetical protein HOA16_12670 [Opitutae bacterium]|nr:hypothetical protein [Opitutae bacterium]MBT6852034.1 hypothetical protein [Opitutae bacterium]MBT7925143.1 hypothetical protein [Opitutae bacterium]
MKSQISRLFAWGLTLMAGIAFAIVPGIVAEKEKRSADRKDSIENLKKEMVVDENASKLALAAVFREISGHREAIDDAQGTFKETKEKVDFLESELAKVAEELKEAEAESEELVPSRLDAQSKLAEVNARLEPLKANANGISAKRQGLEEELGGVQKDNQALQAKLDKLIFAREQILVDFREREKFYRDSIKTPPWIYYADKMNVTVTNARPSGAGVFLPVGYQDGMKKGMEFLVRRTAPDAPSRRSRRLRATLVQSNYCFAEEIPGFGEANVFLQVDEKIEIERSGDSTQEDVNTFGKEDDSSPTSSESNVSSDAIATDS